MSSPKGPGNNPPSINVRSATPDIVEPTDQEDSSSGSEESEVQALGRSVRKSASSGQLSASSDDLQPRSRPRSAGVMSRDARLQKKREYGSATDLTDGSVTRRERSPERRMNQSHRTTSMYQGFLASVNPDVHQEWGSASQLGSRAGTPEASDDEQDQSLLMSKKDINLLLAMINKDGRVDPDQVPCARIKRMAEQLMQDADQLQEVVRLVRSKAISKGLFSFTLKKTEAQKKKLINEVMGNQLEKADKLLTLYRARAEMIHQAASQDSNHLQVLSDSLQERETQIESMTVPAPGAVIPEGSRESSFELLSQMYKSLLTINRGWKVDWPGCGLMASIVGVAVPDDFKSEVPVIQGLKPKDKAMREMLVELEKLKYEAQVLSGMHRQSYQFGQGDKRYDTIATQTDLSYEPGASDEVPSEWQGEGEAQSIGLAGVARESDASTQTGSVTGQTLTQPVSESPLKGNDSDTSLTSNASSLDSDRSADVRVIQDLSLVLGGVSTSSSKLEPLPTDYFYKAGHDHEFQSDPTRVLTNKAGKIADEAENLLETGIRLLRLRGRGQKDYRDAKGKKHNVSDKLKSIQKQFQELSVQWENPIRSVQSVYTEALKEVK